MRRHVLSLLLLTLSVFAASPPLPPGATALHIEVDSSGNGYVAGENFLMKYRLDSGAVAYQATLQDAILLAITVDASGSLYAVGAGSTASRISDQPFRALSGTSGAFAVKLNASGSVAYATLLGPSQSAADLAVNAAGEAYVTGEVLEGEMPATPGAAVSQGGNVRTNFVAKLNAAGDRLLLVERGIGGNRIALDAAGNIYVAGTSGGKQDPPITANALQRTHPCCGEYPHVAKLDPTGTTLLWSTFLTGSLGARPSALQIDDQGNVYVAGTTKSADFPVTEGVIGPKYLATRPFYASEFALIPGSGPADTGFVTKLNAAGNGLVFSTYFGGSRSDWVGDMRLRNGQLYLSGLIDSEDLLASRLVAQECLPRSFVVTLGPDGKSAGKLHILEAPNSSISVDDVGAIHTLGFETIGPADQAEEKYCIVDAASRKEITSIAPGQLISMFGPQVGVGPSLPNLDPDGRLPAALGNMGVEFDGIAARFLYVSPRQANIVVPYELSPGESTTMTTSTFFAHFIATVRKFVFDVVPRTPSAFQVLAPINYCGFEVPIGRIGPPAYFFRPTILVHNEDGSLNSCKNPARAGSIARFFVNGGGIAGTLPITGLIANQATPVSIDASVTRGDLVGVTLDPGSVNGVWRVQFRVPSNVPAGPMEISAELSGMKVTPDTFFVWTAP